MIIRDTTYADLSAIADLHTESWRTSYSDILPSDFLEKKIDSSLRAHWRGVEILDDDLVLIAEEDNQLVGFIAVWCRPTPFIDNLHVRQTHRSANIGTRLMQAAVEILIARGERKGFLWVFHSNDRAIQFYEKLGGIRTESAVKTIFGHGVPSQKIEWDDLSVILEGDN